VIETVYKNRDNPNTVTFKEDGAAIDFSAATRMVLSFKGSAVVADTSVDGSLIDWSQGNGVVEFNINDIGITGGCSYSATLVVYDPAHTDGQVIVHEDSQSLIFSFVA
jgi:hypothetical protein